MPTDTPLNKAHQHASNAEDYLNQGLLIPAAEEHYKSAEAFLRCVDQANDEGTKRTLRMLYTEHNKSGKELQRKIAKLTEEGKDPSLPQRPSPPARDRTNASPSFVIPSTPPHVLARGQMGDSNHTIDESYMVLGQQSDPMDTFNQFWRDLEGMLDNLSQPVAFATAPLVPLLAPGTQGISATSVNRRIHHDVSSSSDDMEFEDVPRSQRGNKMAQSVTDRKQTGNSLRTSVDQSILSRAKAPTDPYDLEEVLADEDSTSSESFFMVPSTSGNSLVTKIQRENESLRIQLTNTQQKLDVAERMRIDQEEQLRERIEHARREAQRVKNSGYLSPRSIPPALDFNSLNFNVAAVPVFPHLSSGNRDKENQLARRVKELEEEVKTLRIENEKQKAMIVKFRERWDKLKESAKRKRDIKTKVGIDSNVRDQRIDEEPEAEIAAEGDAAVTSHNG